MSDRRLIFYSDARHTHVYAYDPPMRVEDVVAPIDDIVGTGVDTFVFGFGSGHTTYHNTAVGETWAEHLIKAGKTTFREPDPWNTLAFWRSYQNMKSLRDRGLDIMELQIERAHEKGIDYWGSLRSNHPQDPAHTGTADNSTFKIEHPELHMQTRPQHPLNWVYPEVRAERLALVEEAFTQYDLDGLEMDFVFCPYLFEEGEVDKNAHIVTEFMEELRQLADKATAYRGRPFAIGARVFPTPEANQGLGLDIAGWIQEELVDFVVPVVYGPRQMDMDMPFEWLVDLSVGTNCEVYPALQDKIFSVNTSGVLQQNRAVYEHSATVEHFRAAAANYWAKGADAIYLPWFEWPVGAEEREILSEVHDPDLLREKRKHYWTAIRDVDDDTEGYFSQLPITLETGVDASRQEVRVHLADDSARARTSLRLKLTGSVAADVMGVTVNGTELDWFTCKTTRHGGGGNVFAWAALPVTNNLLKRGRNDIGVAVLSRPKNLIANVILESVELTVDYPGQMANTEFDRISSGRRM